MRSILWMAAALLLALSPATALAAEPRSGNQVTVAQNETVNDDLYLAGGTIDVLGTVQGDVVATGGTINIPGSVTGDVIAAGGTINLSGQVGGSVRTAGGTVNVNAPVGGDVVSAGGSVNIGPNARITRDMLVGAGSATIDGQVGRNVNVGSGELAINGTVGGNVRSEGAAPRLGEEAVINGSLTYASNQQASIPSGAQVRGGVEQRAVQQAETNPVLSSAIDWLRAVVGLLILGLLFILLFPRAGRRSVDSLRTSPWASLGIGFALLILVPIVAVLAVVAGAFVGGWWVGLVVLAAYIVAVALSVPIAGMSLGDWALDRFGRGRAALGWALLLGVVVLMLVSLVPFLGGIVLFLAVLFGLGALAIATVRGPRPPAVEVSPAAEPPAPRGEVAA